jgi:hypothetical protein
VSLLLLESDLLVGLAVGASVKRLGILLRGGCEVVVKLAISRVEEKLYIVKEPLLCGGSRRIKWPSCAFGNPSWFPHLSNGDYLPFKKMNIRIYVACLDYLFTRVLSIIFIL